MELKSNKRQVKANFQPSLSLSLSLYIFCCVCTVARKVFHDDPDEGHKPKHTGLRVTFLV